MTRNYYLDFDSFYYEWFLSRCVPARRMLSFAEEYAERGVPVVRYERLYANPVAEFGRLIKRLGYEVDEDRLSVCVEEHRLDKLKVTGLDLGYKVETTHFRKGGWGNFLVEMPPSILADVNDRFGNYCRRWGYPLDLSGPSVDMYVAGLNALGSTDEVTG